MFTCLSWLDLLGVTLAFRISILKIFKFFQTTNTWLQISQASKNISKVIQVTQNIFSKFGEISFQEYVSEGILHPVFYDDLILKGLIPGKYMAWIRANFSGGLGPSSDAIKFIIYPRTTQGWLKRNSIGYNNDLVSVRNKY